MYDVKVHLQPPPPARGDSDHNIVYATASAVVLHPTDTCELKNKSGLSIGISLDPTEIADNE